MDHTTLYYCIIGILLLQFLWDTILDYLNARHFDDPIPHNVQDVYDHEAYRKSQAYKKTNYRFGLLSSSFGLLLTLGFLILGGFGWIDGIARGMVENEIGVALLFFGMILLGNDLISLPFSYYHTFVIEERFGFNKTTLKTFAIDKIKGWLMGALLGGGILALIIWFYQWAGTSFWLYAWAVVAVFSLAMNMFYSRLIVPLFNKQTPLDEGSLKSEIEAYAQKVGFALENIFVIDGSKRSTKANAYFSGFGKEKRITLYDTLLADLEEEEIVSVLAHEVGHYKKRHIIYNLLGSLTLTGITLYILGVFINNPNLSLAIGVSQPSFHAGLIGFGILYSPISTLTGLFMNQLSRKFEFQADYYAKETYGGRPLESSLKKLSKSSLGNLTPHPAYVFVHYSHPPLTQRIAKLQV